MFGNLKEFPICLIFLVAIDAEFLSQDGARSVYLVAMYKCSLQQPPPQNPPSSQAMQILPVILLLLLLPQIQGFKPINIQTNRREANQLTAENVLDAVNDGLTNWETGQILKQLFRKHLERKFMKVSQKGFTVTLKKKDLVTLFSEKTNMKKNQEKSDYMISFSFIRSG